MPERGPRVMFVIPNRNGRGLLELVIPSILAQRHPVDSIVLVDDASTDDSVAYARRRWPALEVIECRRQRGFAATVNTALERARADYVAIVNTDVELDPGWLTALVDALERHPEAASATGKAHVHRLDGGGTGPPTLDGAGNQLRWSGGATRRGYGDPDTGQFDHPEEVISACAGYALYRRSALANLGGFDEDLVAYYEDVDWGLRAQLAGYSCRYEPAAVARHIGGASHGGDRRYLRLQRRNQLLVVLKNFPASLLLRHLPEIVIGQLILIARGLADGSAGLQLRAIADAIAAAPPTLRKRRPATAAGARRLMRLIAPERYVEAPRRALAWRRP